MRKTAALVCTLVSLVLVSCADNKGSYSASVSEKWIVPAYQNLAQSTQNLRISADLACEDQSLSDAEWAQLRSAWQQGMSSWQHAQIIHFGPIEIDNQRWLYQFWPDMHNNIRRKVQPLIEKNDAIDMAQLKTAGVVARGFTALEYALYDEAISKDQVKGVCAFVKIAAWDIEQTSANLLASWQKDALYRQQFDQPHEKNPVFPRAKDTEAALLDSIVAQLEVIRMDKLAGPLGLKTARSRPNAYLTESWRSKTSLSWLSVNLMAVEDLLLAPDYGLVGQIVEADVRAQLTQQLQLQTNAVKDSLKALEGLSFAEALVSEQEKLQTLHNAWQTLLSNVKQNLPKALGVTLGFNANDGD